MITKITITMECKPTVPDKESFTKYSRGHRENLLTTTKLNYEDTNDLYEELTEYAAMQLGASYGTAE
jgi:predicted metal-binding protein